MAYRTRLDINQGLDLNFNISNITFVDGLTADKVKIRYNWFFNGKVLNAVVGEDSYGLVWYSGDWLCGDWWDGTWYSGTFNGRWRNGNFYSYLLDPVDVLKGTLRPLIDDNIYSTFSGLWQNGNFYNGTFLTSGSTTSWNDFWSGSTDNITTSVWENGTFFNGILKDSIWLTGKFMGGNMTNSQWLSGSFFNGTFQGYWTSGDFKGGDFIYGYWSGGTFSQISPTTISRFCTNGTAEGSCLWMNGIFRNGEFGSTDNSVAIWENGIYESGTWIGGHFKKGQFIGGNWLGGIFGDYTTTDYVYCTSITETGDTSLTVWTGITNAEGNPNCTDYSSCLVSPTAKYISNYNILLNGNISRTLVFSGFTFNIPTDSKIIDIEVKIIKGNTIGDVIDEEFSISKTGLINSGIEDKSLKNTTWNQQTGIYHFTGSNFTSNEINNGINILQSAKFKTFQAVNSVRIYSCSVRITYSSINTPIWRNGNWGNGYWISGTFINGQFNDGFWESGNFDSGILSD